MARYAGFNINKKRRVNKPLFAALCVLAAVLLVLFIIGVTTGKGNEEMARMSTAVRENTELKEQVSLLTEEINRLNAQIADLQAQIDTMATLPPEETANPGETPPAAAPQPASEPLSPREGFR